MAGDYSVSGPRLSFNERRKNMSLNVEQKKFAIQEAVKVATAYAQSPEANKSAPEDTLERIYKKIEKLLSEN